MNDELKITFTNISCSSCELWLKTELKSINGVKKIITSESNYITVKFDPAKISKKELIDESDKLLIKHGAHTLSNEAKKPLVDIIVDNIIFFLIGLILYFLYTFYIGEQSLKGAGLNLYWFQFFLGLFSSFTTCGLSTIGIISSWVTNYEKLNPNSDNKLYRSIGIFHLTRFVGFVLIGGIVGYLGKQLELDNAYLLFEYLSLFIILFFSVELLGINLKFSKFKLKSKLLDRFVNKHFQNKLFAPISLAIVTILIPCAFSTAAILNSIESGNFMNGMIMMAIFVLGTLPVLITISLLTKKFSEWKYRKSFYKILAYVMIIYVLHQLFLNIKITL